MLLRVNPRSLAARLRVDVLAGMRSAELEQVLEVPHLLSDLFYSTSPAGKASQVTNKTTISFTVTLHVCFSCVLFSCSCQMLRATHHWANRHELLQPLGKFQLWIDLHLPLSRGSTAEWLSENSMPREWPLVNYHANLPRYSFHIV